MRVFAARTVRWRGIFAVHCWIVFKERGATPYSRYDYTAWGEPIRINGFLAGWPVVRRRSGNRREPSMARRPSG